MSEMLHSLSAVLLVLMIISVGYAFGRIWVDAAKSTKSL